MKQYNYYVMTTCRADTDLYHRVARGPVGEWTMSHYWSREDSRWYPIACTYARNVVPATRYSKRRNAHLAMLALARLASRSSSDRLNDALTTIQRRDRAARGGK